MNANQTMKTTVIYHSADFDGIFCREIARKFLGDEDVQYIGWNFGDPPLEIPSTAIYVMDLPLDRPFGFDYSKTGNAHGPTHPPGLVWIDHHKSSIESHPIDIPGYRIDGVAACRLAWQWFQENAVANRTGEAVRLPEKQHFIDRVVSEPLAVRLAGEYDIWDKRDSDADTFQYGLRIENDGAIQTMLVNDDRTKDTVERGKIAQLYGKNVDASICKSLTWLMEWEGLKFLCVNHARFNSLLFDAKDVPETGHDALLGFRFDGKKWMVSLYHAKHRKDLDLSLIAVKHGGGGHRGACGFVCEKLPFL